MNLLFSVYSTSELMTSSRFKSDPTASQWNLCDKCELVVPPRSWHCDICGVCILKRWFLTTNIDKCFHHCKSFVTSFRDHHCMFASNCVGHSNHRNFLVFLLYFFIGTTYAFGVNSYYIWILNQELFLTWTTFVKMALPMFMMFQSTGKEMHLLYYMLILIGSALSGVLLIFHGKLVIRNSLTHEKNKGEYDQGTAANLKLIFGSRWLLSLVWPFTDSPLPKIYWKTAESCKSKWKPKCIREVSVLNFLFWSQFPNIARIAISFCIYQSRVNFCNLYKVFSIFLHIFLC